MTRFRVDYMELIAKLQALGIAYPQVRSDTEEWYRYLVYLAELAETGLLYKAQQLYFPSANEPSSEK